MVLPGLDDASAPELSEFHADWLAAGARRSTPSCRSASGWSTPCCCRGCGRSPRPWPGAACSCRWSGRRPAYGLMGVVNPVLQERVDWPWFIVSQFVFGVVAAIVVVRSEKIYIPPAGRGPDRVAEFVAGDRGRSVVNGLAMAARREPARTARSPVLVALVGRAAILRPAASPGQPRRRPARAGGPGRRLRRPVRQELRRLPRGRRQARPGAAAQRPDVPGHRPRRGAADDVIDGRATARDARCRPSPAARGGPLTDAQVKALAEGIKPRLGNRPSSRRSAAAVRQAAEARTGATRNEGSRFRPRLRRLPREPMGRAARAGPVGAINDPAFLALISDQALRRIVITGRPDLGMPTYAEGKSRPAGLPAAELDRRSTTWSRSLWQRWKASERSSARSATSSDAARLARGSWQRNATRDSRSVCDGTVFQPDTAPAEPSRPAHVLPLADLRAGRYRRRGRRASRSSATSSGPASNRINWVPLGPVEDFPPDETRLVTFDNPLRQPWDGMTAHTGVYVRYEGEGRATRQGPVPGPGHQLRPPGLPGVVVPAVGPVHVPLPRRRLLRQRRTRLRARRRAACSAASGG